MCGARCEMCGARCVVCGVSGEYLVILEGVVDR